MLTVGSTVRGLNGRIYTLGPELGSGGEGTVYDMPDLGMVVKVYKNPQHLLEQKLRYMVMHPVPSLTDQYGNPILNLAWPRDIVYDQQNFVGYAMPKLENALDVYQVVRGCQSPKAKKMWPNYTWELNIQVARNLALSVFHLHSSGYVVGDMNDKNIMVRADGAVCILDIDSFDFTDASTGVHYRCGVGLADYLAPELQGRNLQAANFTPQSDDFALAIHIFQLLMDNYHPFTGRRLVQTQNSSSANQRVQRMAEGICPFVRNIPGYEIPDGAPRLEEVLPPKLRADFAQTLTYDSTTAISAISQRTTAEQWFRDLNDFLKACRGGDLVRCSTNPEHFYLRSIGTCGRCAAQRRSQAAQAGYTHQPAAPVSAHRPVTVGTTPQPTVVQNAGGGPWKDRYFVTEEEARKGGMIAVYENGKKEYRQLPSYADISQGKTMVKIMRTAGEFSLRNWNISRYSDGCLAMVSSGSTADFVYGFLAGLWMAAKWLLMFQIGLFFLDWGLEAVCDINLIPGMFWETFVITLPPFCYCPAAGYFFISWRNILYAAFFYLWPIYHVMKERKDSASYVCQEELNGRKRL